MNSLSIFTLKALRKIYCRIVQKDMPNRNWTMFSNKEYAFDLIYKELMADKPSMIARIGAIEMSCLTNYIGVHSKNKDIYGYIIGVVSPWWWERKIAQQMSCCAGFFSANPKNMEQFARLMIEDMQQVDILGSWLAGEKQFKNELGSAKKVVLEDLEPFFTKNPWTKALAGKKVLVIHPFAKTIEQQYTNRNKIFPDGLLPDFELTTITAVQTIAGVKSEFNDWFEALEHMKTQINEINYDICVIGCGAYGFPLAAHVKRMGKKAIHLAGVTQLLFGIKGRRWEEYIVWPYENLYNEYWVRPSDNETPQAANKVEGGCYW